MIEDGRITAYTGFGNRQLRIDLNQVDAALEAQK